MLNYKHLTLDFMNEKIKMDNMFISALTSMLMAHSTQSLSKSCEGCIFFMGDLPYVDLVVCIYSKLYNMLRSPNALLNQE